MKYLLSSYMGTWNSNLLHERDNCVIGRKVGYISEVSCPLWSQQGFDWLYFFMAFVWLSHTSEELHSTEGNCACCACVSTGLNGRPVCMVRDDWFVTSSLFPHPLLRSHGIRKAAGSSFTFPLSPSLNGVSGNKNKSGMDASCYFNESPFSISPPQLQDNESDFSHYISQHCFQRPGGMNLKSSLQESVRPLKHQGTRDR